jgi:hypothetical protein
MAHISLDRLLKFAAGKLAKEEEDRVERHLSAGCVRCSENLAWSTKVFNAAQREVLREPPESLVERAVELFESRKRKSRVGFLERIEAVLVFDSLTQPSLAGVRRIGTTGRQLLYRAGSLDIDLRVVEGDDPKLSDLMGQILRKKKGLISVAGLELLLKKGRKKIQSTRSDSWGEFSFSKLSPGRYRVEVNLPGQRVEIRGIQV